MQSQLSFQESTVVAVSAHKIKGCSTGKWKKTPKCIGIQLPMYLSTNMYFQQPLKNYWLWWSSFKSSWINFITFLSILIIPVTFSNKRWQTLKMITDINNCLHKYQEGEPTYQLRFFYALVSIDDFKITRHPCMLSYLRNGYTSVPSKIIFLSFTTTQGICQFTN